MDNAHDTVITDGDEYINAKERFAELIADHRSNALQEIEENMNEAQRNHDSYTRRARNSLWELNDLKNSYEQLKSAEESKKENFDVEFDALLRHAKVDALGIRNYELLIKTTELNMEHPETGERKPLGEFEISIPLNSGRSQYLSIQNRTNAREHEDGLFHHPHILGEDACFGSLEDQLITCLSNGEISGVFELILQYLQSINPDDSRGTYWDLW